MMISGMRNEECGHSFGFRVNGGFRSRRLQCTLRSWIVHDTGTMPAQVPRIPRECQVKLSRHMQRRFSCRHWIVSAAPAPPMTGSQHNSNRLE